VVFGAEIVWWRSRARQGSLTVIGPTGEVVGAKSEEELGAVSGEAGLLSSGVEQMGCGGIGGEVSTSELL